MKTYKTIIAFVVTLLCITSSITTTDTLIQNEKTSTQSISVNTQLNNIEKSNSTNNFDIGSIPKYVGKPYIIINDNKPFFTEKDITNESFEKLSSPDALGRYGNNLLASGVLMEGYSTEDNGESVCFNVYCYNVQPGIEINYANGESVAADKSAQYEDNHDTSQKTDSNNRSETTYILNTSTKKFHYQNCESVKHMKDKNIKYITCTRDQAISQGFSRCKLCNP